MTNDTNTLNGALQELGETMAANLVTKGVQASASDGLTTLAGKILDISGGGSCYHIEFDQASYVAVGGSVTVSFTLQSNYAPLGSATVTLSDGSSQYSCITNSNGVGTYTFTGLSSDKTLTATYSNVSDSCSVTVQTHLYAPTLDGTETLYQINGTTTVSNGEMSGGTCYLTTGWDNSIDWELSFEAYFDSRDGESIQLSFGNPTKADYNCIRFLCPAYNRVQTNKPSTVYNDGSLSGVTNGSWMSFNVKKQSSTMTVKIGNNNATTHTYRFTDYTSFPIVCIGTNSWGNVAKLRNIIVDAL